MTVRWPPSDWDEADLRRDEETRLPTQMYPFYMGKDEDDRDLWRVGFDPRDGKAKPKEIGGPVPIFTAFRIMLDAYEAWLPIRPVERVYFIGSELRVGGMVKIGFSLNPDARLRQLQTSSHEQLRIFATVPGGRHLEEKYHRRWKPRRKAGEWFVLGDCILDEIARLNAPIPGKGPSATTHERMRFGMADSDLMALAARVESADPNDWRALRTLAKDIYRSLNELPVLVTGGYGWQEDDSGWWLQTGEDQRCPRKRIDPPNWLASLDAAMSLVPEGWEVSLNTFANPPRASAYLINAANEMVRPGKQYLLSASLAIISAALRAHSLPIANEAGR